LSVTRKKFNISDFLQRAKVKIRTLYNKFRQKYLVFIFFVGLSTLAWYIRALSDTYVADIDYPVKYTNLPPNRMLSKEPPQKLRLRVQADGYTILSSRIKYKRPLNYNVNAFALFSLTEDSTSVYTLTWYARERLSAELSLANKNIQILDISPDTLIFNFSRIKRKKVPVTVVLANSPDMFKKQFMLNGLPIAYPDSILVSGPSFIIDTFRQVYTLPLHLKNLSDTVQRRVKLQEANRIIFPLNKVKVMIPVDEFTEAQFDVPLLLKGVPDSLVLKTFPSSVKVKYIIALSHFNDVKQDLITAYINYNTIDPELSSKLKIELDSIPSYVYNISITPRSVDYLIERKYAKSRTDGRNR
jgi:hypothetical protein